MSDYSKTTNFTAKDSLSPGDPDKVIKGSLFDTEFDAISTAVATKSNKANPTFTGTATFGIIQTADYVLPTTDGAAGQAIITDGAGTTSWGTISASGAMSVYAGSSAPTGWLLCYGQAVSRSTYAALFAVVGTTYGVGDGSTTFNLPDMRGRMAIGLDNMGGSSANVVTNAAADTLGGTSGSETHTLTEAELPAHNHRLLGDGGGNDTNGYGLGNAGVYGLTGRAFGGTYYDVPGGTSNQLVEDTGSGTAHDIMSPYMALNWIIKY